MIAFQSGEEDGYQVACLVVGQIGHGYPDAAEGDVGALGEDLLAVGELEHHGRAEVHALFLSPVMAGEGDGADIERTKRADGQRQIVAAPLVEFVPGLQRLVDPQGVAVPVEVALGLKQLDGLGGHEVGHPVELMHLTEGAQLVAHVDDAPTGGALAFEFHLQQEPAVRIFVLGQTVEDFVEVLFPEQGDKLFYQM